MTGLRTPPRPVPLMRRPVVIGLLALAAVAVAFGIGVGSMTRESALVAAVTVDNPTPYNLQVDVAAPGGEEVVELGTVPREGSRAFEQVVDQGGQWAFRLTFGGREVGEIVVSRAQLEEAGWRVSVPGDVARALAEAGHPPSARSGT